MKISEMIKALQYEEDANGDRDIIIDICSDNDLFKTVSYNNIVQIPPGEPIYFNSDEENLYIQNFPY